MSEEVKKRLLKIIAKHGDEWWNDEDDYEGTVVEQVTAKMILDELSSFCTKENLEITLAECR